jgi:hypothetical protein
MYRFANEVLNENRTPSQALADLTRKYHKLDFNRPERSALAQMIELLQAEITLRGREGHLQPAA